MSPISPSAVLVNEPLLLARALVAHTLTASEPHPRFRHTNDETRGIPVIELRTKVKRQSSGLTHASRFPEMPVETSFRRDT